MAQEKAGLFVRLRHTGYSPLRRRITGAFVMVATDEQYFEIRVQFAPRDEGSVRLRRHAALGVQKVSENDEAGGLRLFQHSAQAIEVALPDGCGYGDPVAAKGGVLAEMHVGKIDTTSLPLPDRSLSQQAQVRSIPFYIHGDTIRLRSRDRTGLTVKSPPIVNVPEAAAIVAVVPLISLPLC